MDNLELNAKLKELRQLKRMADELHAEIAAAEDAVKEELTSRGVDELLTDEYKVTWKPVTSIRLDAKALKAEQPDLYLRYARKMEVRRFLVT